jgi:hypothetical protein
VLFVRQQILPTSGMTRHSNKQIENEAITKKNRKETKKKTVVVEGGEKNQHAMIFSPVLDLIPSKTSGISPVFPDL